MLDGTPEATDPEALARLEDLAAIELAAIHLDGQAKARSRLNAEIEGAEDALLRAALRLHAAGGTCAQEHAAQLAASELARRTGRPRAALLRAARLAGLPEVAA